MKAMNAIDVKIEADNCSKFCGCNTGSHILDCDVGSNLIAFGSGPKVCLITAETEKRASKIVETFAGHTSTVLCVKWIKSSLKTPLLLSSANDNVCLLWKVASGSLKLANRFVAHDAAVNYCCGYASDEFCLVFTASADFSSHLWLTADIENLDKWTKIQTMNYGHGFALCADFVRISSVLVLATGHDDCSVRLHVAAWSDLRSKDVSEDRQVFKTVEVLRGHENWVQSLSFSSRFGEHYFLASSSQDTYVRVWRFGNGLSRNTSNSIFNVDEVLSDAAISLKPRYLPVSMESNGAECDKAAVEIQLETVLKSHEGWVYSATWRPCSEAGKTISPQLQLLTASIDKSIIVWEPESLFNSSVWFEKYRLGDVGGNTLGFYGAVYSADGECIIGHAYQGGLHGWRFNKKTAAYDPMVLPSGHFAAVEDVKWDPAGQYLISCSADQTTRLFAAWNRGESFETTYHEIARPQIHGYAMQCIATISSACFVSGGEEKILRVFSAPNGFVQNFQRICAVDDSIMKQMFSTHELAEGASVPSLGLSNKAVYEVDLTANEKNVDEESSAKDLYPSHFFAPADLHSPPTEDYMLQNTLWPEVHKLYGHPIEVFAVASNHSGTIIASSCKATNVEHAIIILWATSSWDPICKLSSHSLTVTCLAFSPDDQFLLSVSRDRTWALFRRDDSTWTKFDCNDKRTSLHSRIIWACAWAPDSKHFATVSRDKKLIVWSIKSSSDDLKSVEPCSLNPSAELVSAVATEEFSESVTAVDISKHSICSNVYVAAVGLETGDIYLCLLDFNAYSIQKILHMDQTIAHSGTVKRLQFRPVTGLMGKKSDFKYIQLASCGDDHAVKIYDLQIKS